MEGMKAQGVGIAFVRMMTVLVGNSVSRHPQELGGGGEGPRREERGTVGGVGGVWASGVCGEQE